MESFETVVNKQTMLTIVAKLSILECLRGPGYASGLVLSFYLSRQLHV